MSTTSPMGYGIAYPIHVLNALLQDNVPLKVNFVDKVVA